MTQVFTTGSGQSIIAGAELGHGGEGTILEVRGDLSRCIKVYGGQVAAATFAKLAVMIAHPPIDPTLGNRRHHSIAWPQQILFKAPGKAAFAGFLMPRVDSRVFRPALTYLSPEARVKELGGSFNWKYLYTAATNVASSVGALHEKGYCIGDLNESNLLIAPNALITIIDCDSFQVPDPAAGRVYRCLVGKPEYTAPELQGRYGEIDRTLASDRFALGVLLFQLLMEGTHPYQARGEAVEDLPSTQQKILKGLFPYSHTARGVAPPAFAPPFDLLDPTLRKLFLRCFDAGHGDPAARPAAQEWFDSLRNRESLLLACKVNDNHIYFSHLAECPWCKRAQVMGRDSFPSPLGTQIALADPRAPLPSVEARLRDLRKLVAFALADGVVAPQEREYLINRGLELQLTKAQVETLLDAEIRRSGVKRPGTPAPRFVLSTAKPLPGKPAGWGGFSFPTRRQARGAPVPYRVFFACAVLAASLFAVYYPDLRNQVLGVPDTAAPAPASSFRVAVTEDSAILLSRPDLGARVVEQVPRGTVLEVDYAFGSWFRVVRQEKRGWVHQDQVQRLAAPAQSTARAGSRPAPVVDQPSLPFKDEDACLAEKCAYGNWVALRGAVARKEPQSGAAVAFTVHRGEEVWAENGFVLTLASGNAMVIRETSIGTSRLKIGDTVYPLHAVGEDQYRVWYQDHAYDADKEALEVFDQPKAVWWVRIRNADFVSGWTDQAAAFRPKRR
ncbi:MAG: SH3 domain-containing protein [Thermoanaerobaculia bacterium]